MELNAIYAGLVLLAIWLFTACLYRDYRNDVFRQHLFALRDRLFDLACDGKIAFDNPAYWRLRRSLNALLLSAEDMSVLGTLVIRFSLHRDETWRAHVERTTEAWNEAIADLDPSVAAEVEGIHARANLRLLEHLVFTSPLLQLLIVPLILIGLCRLAVTFLDFATKQSVITVGRKFTSSVGVDVISSPFAEKPGEHRPSGIAAAH